MLYRPQLSNREPIPMLWPITTYRLLNIICWPISDGAGLLVRGFDRFCWLLAFLIFLQHNEAEVRYLVYNYENLDELLSGMPTYLILIEVHLRGFQLGSNKEHFKRFLQKFYTEIYVDGNARPVLYRGIQRRLRPIFAYCALYFSTLGSYLAMATYNLVNKYRIPLYKMIYPFDITPIWIYVPILLSNIWVGFIVTSMIIGEDCVLSEVILHLNARLHLMREDLHDRAEKLLARADSTHIADDFGRIIVRTIEENMRLHNFAQEFQREFTFRIFIILAFSATLLCALGFKVYTNPVASFAFIFWMCAKILEMLLIGELGSTLTVTTNNISTMYYESNWELVIQRSSDSRANVRLMKLILVAMETSQKPFALMGLNFFSVSVTAVITILQGAGSYFTCLIALR